MMNILNSSSYSSITAQYLYIMYTGVILFLSNLDNVCEFERVCVISKEIAVAQRKMEIALIRGMSRENILSHDLLDDTIPFVESSTTTKASSDLTQRESYGRETKGFMH